MPTTYQSLDATGKTANVTFDNYVGLDHVFTAAGYAMRLGGFQDPAVPWTDATPKSLILYRVSDGVQMGPEITISTADIAGALATVSERVVSKAFPSPVALAAGTYRACIRYGAVDQFLNNVTPVQDSASLAEGHVTIGNSWYGSVAKTMPTSTINVTAASLSYIIGSLPTPTITLTPSTGSSGATQTVTIPGTNTTWSGGTVFSIVSGGTGANIASQSVATDTQIGTISLVNGSTTGPIVIGNSTDSAQATFTVTAPAGLTFAGPLSVSASDPTGITIGYSAATGGTSPYSYGLYESATDPFTPPGAGTLVATGSGASLKDTRNLTRTRAYRVLATDSAGTPATAASAQAAHQGALFVRQGEAAIKALGAGNSILRGFGSTDPATTSPAHFGTTSWFAIMAGLLRQAYPDRSIACTNAGIDGSTAASWAGSPLTTALASVGTGVTHVWLCFGTNEAKPGIRTTASAFQTQLQTLITQVLAYAPAAKILIPGPTYSQSDNSTYDETAQGLLIGYQEMLANLAVAGQVYVDPYFGFDFMAQNTGDFYDDIHPDDAGYAGLGAGAFGFARTVLSPSAASATRPAPRYRPLTRTR